MTTFCSLSRRCSRRTNWRMSVYVLVNRIAIVDNSATKADSSIERQLRHHLYDPGSPTSLPMDSSKARHRGLLNRGVRDKVGGTFNAIHGLNLSAAPPARSMELRESSTPRESYVFVRGNPVRRGERVEPKFLTVLSNVQSQPFEAGRMRRGLADAIVDPANPLTRRVMVNWV